jgi:hypothetical protein
VYSANRCLFPRQEVFGNRKYRPKALFLGYTSSLGTQPSLRTSYFQLMPAGSRRPAFSPYSMLVDELRLSSYCYGRVEVSQPILPSPQAVENVGILSLHLLRSSKLLSSRAQPQ